ncbi:MAG TPA: zinc-binding dehydrogenase [Chloroflexota bacterium]|nr:zinc-binding dehydrogenase [Chloroflexota bacterium]
MKALIYHGPNQSAVEDVPVPSIGPDEVLVRSHVVGICHSDFELLEGRYIIGFQYPITPGHEWAGEVVEVGANVTDLAPGDRVVGECVVGPAGRDHFGFSISGAAAEFFAARREWLHRIPDELTYRQAALVEPFSVAYNAIRCLGGVDPSDTVAVIGAGPIGLLSMMAAAACNARVVAIEPDAGRRQWALQLGAAQALDPSSPAFVEGASAATAGRGFDAVIEAAGAPTAMATALEVAANFARVAYVGINVGSTAPARLGLIQSKSLRLQGMVGSVGVWPQTIRFLARGIVDPARIVTASIPLASATEALAAARDTARNIKVHIATSV